jgi:uncharacterized protein (TIGR02147 family)
MTNIFEYTDFRAYLKKCYEEKKKKNPGFSYEVFARIAGFANRGFLFNILKGKKNLSKLYCYKFSKALNHSKEESEYFENIVAYDLAKNDEERDYYYRKALQCKSGTAAPAYMLRKDQYEYLSKWYHSAVRAIIGLKPFEGDYLELCRKLSPSITKTQAKKSVQLLERLGLIAKKNGSVYYVTEPKIKAGDEISQTGRNRFLLECIELAKNSIVNHLPETRNISLITLGISERTYEIICKKTQQFREEISELAKNDEKPDRVYQYQFIFFPLMKN